MPSRLQQDLGRHSSQGRIDFRAPRHCVDKRLTVRGVYPRRSPAGEQGLLYAASVVRTARRLGKIAAGEAVAITVYDELERSTREHDGIPILTGNMHEGGCKRSALGLEVDARIARPARHMLQEMKRLGELYAPMLGVDVATMDHAFSVVRRVAAKQVEHLMVDREVPSQQKLRELVGEERVMKVQPDSGIARGYVLNHHPEESVALPDIFVDTIAANIMEIKQTWTLNKVERAVAACAVIANGLATEDAILAHYPDAEAFDAYKTSAGGLSVVQSEIIRPDGTFNV